MKITHSSGGYFSFSTLWLYEEHSCTHFQYSDTHLGVKGLDHTVTRWTVPHSGYYIIYIPTSNAQGLHTVHIFSNTCSFHFNVIFLNKQLAKFFTTDQSTPSGWSEPALTPHCITAYPRPPVIFPVVSSVSFCWQEWYSTDSSSPLLPFFIQKPTWKVSSFCLFGD